MYIVFGDEYEIIWKDGIIDTVGTHEQIIGRICELENQGYVLNEDFYIERYLD